ncbi:hypothetical protein OEA41_004062 [Lepraria neglecta]|uniref:Uncharacterized protein n=1 Tax=Lepraria neglecta TaxID=209136 RepID=A0AAD9Z6W7_9LECA|nr:hypothetical protein OEA41_004062 [Lepraria neglecta]
MTLSYDNETFSDYEAQIAYALKLYVKPSDIYTLSDETIGHVIGFMRGDSMKSKRSAPIWKQLRGQRYTIEPRTAQMTSDAVRNQTSDDALRQVRLAIRFGPRDSVTKNGSTRAKLRLGILDFKLVRFMLSNHYPENSTAASGNGGGKKKALSKAEKKKATQEKRRLFSSRLLRRSEGKRRHSGNKVIKVDQDRQKEKE